jgi:CheY-like chemotaxis protein
MAKKSLLTRMSPSGGSPAGPAWRNRVPRLRGTGIASGLERSRPSLGGTLRPIPWPERPRGDPRLAPDEFPGAGERSGGKGTSTNPETGQSMAFGASPSTGAEPPALSPATEETRETTVRRRVLVVEDNRDSAASLSVLLELMGHEVRVAYTGPEAVALAAEWPPEITISDIGLPGFDGFEVARRLRGQLGRGPLLVALTGYGRDEDRRMSQEAGFDHHLVKPADPAVIQRMLQTKK